VLVATVPGGFQEWIPRLLMPCVAIGAPLLAKVASWPRLIRVVIVALALVGLYPTLFRNETKRLLPSGGMPSFLGLDRIAQMTYNNYPDLGPALRRLDRMLPDTAPLGYVGSADSWDYPLFGEHRQRRLVRLPQNGVTESQMRRDHLAGVFFAYVTPPPNLGAVQLYPGYYLALRRPL
jgi:hypothetical protein